MNRLSIVGAALVCSWSIAQSCLAADPPATTPPGPAAEQPAPSGEQPAPSAAGAAQPAAAQASGDAWRFRRHHDTWWYWLPTEKWVYWTGKQWVPYDAQSYATFYAQRHPRVYSYSGTGRSNYPAQSGYWGPVHYNQYGTPQYPYSRRTTGVRQLGPVPAMGGVRSLPGWGGER